MLLKRIPYDDVWSSWNNQKSSPFEVEAVSIKDLVGLVVSNHSADQLDDEENDSDEKNCRQCKFSW